MCGTEPRKTTLDNVVTGRLLQPTAVAPCEVQSVAADRCRNLPSSCLVKDVPVIAIEFQGQKKGGS